VDVGGLDMDGDLFEEHAMGCAAQGNSPGPGPIAARATWNQMVCALDDGIDFSNDYCFFSKKMQASWAGGPGQWKPQNAARKDGEKKKRADKVAFMIDFDTAHEMDIEAKLAPSTRAGSDRLSDNAIEKSLEAASSLLLPSDHQYQASQLLTLFLRPTRRVRRMKGGAGAPAADGAHGYNYSNDADVNNYVADFDDDHDDGGFGDDFGGDFGGGMDNDFSQDGGSLELIDEPTKVAKIDIHFERVAKKLDVKALKGAMWGRLQDEKACDAEGRQKFTELLEDIPKIVPEEMCSSISVPFCFICLLHLANEKTLELTDCSSLDQLAIKLDA